MTASMKWLLVVGLVATYASRGLANEAPGQDAKLTTENGAFEVTNALHESLQETLRSNPHVRVLKLDDPRRCRKTKRTKNTPSSRCALNIKTTEIGTHGIRSSFAFMITEKPLSEVTLNAIVNAFPCVSNGHSEKTTCRHKIPDEADNATWTMMVDTPPQPWTGPVPNPTVFTGDTPYAFSEDDPISLYNIVVAKTIYETGVYASTGRLTVGHDDDADADGVVYLRVDRPDNSSIGCASARLVVTKRLRVPSAVCSWRSQRVGGDLVVDLSLALEESTTAARSVIRYTIQDVTAEPEWMRRFDVEVNLCGTEPRLCTVGSLASACRVMTAATPPQVGNVLGFMMNTWGRVDTRLHMRGSVIVDKGVVHVDHTAPLLDENRLVELPRDLLTCAARLFTDKSQCQFDNAGDWIGQFNPAHDDVLYPFM